MAFFIFAVKAALLKKKLKKYEEEKSLIIDEYLYGITREKKERKRKRFLKRFEGSAFGRYLLRFKTKNMKENMCLKSFIGFFGGILLTYIYFFFFVFGLRIQLRGTTYICAIFGIIFCLGLAFSKTVRCYVLLMIPVFFSKQGRQVLLSYALYLSLTGPFKNTLENIGILSDSLNCGQEMIKKTLHQIEDMVKAPFRAMKEILAKVVKILKEALKKIKEFLDNIKRIILGILHVIKKAVSWLGSIINICNKKLGTPFQRCMRTFDDAIEDCKAKMGVMDFLCHIVHVVKPLCYTVKFLDLLCMFKEFISDSVIGVIKRKLKEFGTMVKTMFYVSIEFSHTLDYTMESSNSTKMVAATIIQTFTEKLEDMNKIFSFIGWACSFFFIYIIFRIYYYKYKFMSSDRYDNRYITKHITELDLKRLEMNKETVLPLEMRERKYFCRPTALRLLRDERISIFNSMMVLSLSTLEIASFILCDYCLYWVLFTIYKEGHREYAQVESGEVELHVSGTGPLAEFYTKLGKTLKMPKNMDFDLNLTQCLPDPIPPDKDRYIQIGCLTGICWVLTITEAYGLRLRNIVMSHYYPDRAKERAVWLYNHILRSRGTFLKFARRQLRRKRMGEKDEPIERVTFKERLLATMPFLGIFFGKSKEDVCLLCGGKSSDQEPLIRCRTPNCVGKYCLKCYATLNNTCTVCQNPIEYGDVSDISEERDSSEEDYNEWRKIPQESSSNSSNLSSQSESEEDSKTFQDMETRPKFRDLEQNVIIQFARTSDFDSKEGSDREFSLQSEKFLDTFQTYQLTRKKASNLLSKLMKQRLDKLKLLKHRKIRLIRALREHVKNQKLINSKGIPLDETDKYKEFMKKMNKLRRKLKEKKLQLIDGHKNVFDWDKENKTILDMTDCDILRSMALERVKRTLRERRKRFKNDEFDVLYDMNHKFDKENSYLGAFPIRSDGVTCLKINELTEDNKQKFSKPSIKSSMEIKLNILRKLSVYHLEREIKNSKPKYNDTLTACKSSRDKDEKKFVHLR